MTPTPDSIRKLWQAYPDFKERRKNISGNKIWLMCAKDSGGVILIDNGSLHSVNFEDTNNAITEYDKLRSPADVEDILFREE